MSDAALRETVLRIILEADPVCGITATSIHGRINEGRCRCKPAQIRRICDALGREGRISVHLQNKAGVVRFARPGVAPITFVVPLRERQQVETSAMSRTLRGLYALCLHDYAHGEVVTLERGRIGLRPPLPLPGRAIGDYG